MASRTIRLAILALVMVPMVLGLESSQTRDSAARSLGTQLRTVAEQEVAAEGLPNARKIARRMHRRIESRMEHLNRRDIRRAPKSVRVTYQRKRDRSAAAAAQAEQAACSISVDNPPPFKPAHKRYG